MPLTVGETLFTPFELDELSVDLLLLRRDALLRLDRLRTLVVQLALGLGAELQRLLPYFDLRLAADRLGRAGSLGHQALPVLLRRGEPASHQHSCADDRPGGEPEQAADDDADENQHGSLLRQAS